MYSRNLLETNPFGWISDILLPFSRRTHCENAIVYQKFISKFFAQKIPRVHLQKRRIRMEYVWKDRKRNALGLPWTFTTYALSEDRLFINTGLLKTVEDEVRLYRILDLSLSRTLFQRIFGIGTIRVSSADKSMGDFEIKNIKKPSEVKEQLSRLVEENRDKKRVTNREYMSDDVDDDPDE